MDPSLERDLNLEVQVEPQAERVALAAAAAAVLLLLVAAQRAARDVAQRALGAVGEVSRRLADLARGKELVPAETAQRAPTAAAAALLSLLRPLATTALARRRRLDLLVGALVVIDLITLAAVGVGLLRRVGLRRRAPRLLLLPARPRPAAAAGVSGRRSCRAAGRHDFYDS